MTAAEQAAAKDGPITQVPVDLGGEGIAYNLSLPSGARLHLTGPVLAEIYLGQISRWNDPAITALNPGITLPPAAINVVHRSDGRGTTYIFSNYLSAVSPAWAAKVGTGKTLPEAGIAAQTRTRLRPDRISISSRRRAARSRWRPHRNLAAVAAGPPDGSAPSATKDAGTRSMLMSVQ